MVIKEVIEMGWLGPLPPCEDPPIIHHLRSTERVLTRYQICRCLVLRNPSLQNSGFGFVLEVPHLRSVTPAASADRDKAALTSQRLVKQRRKEDDVNTHPSRAHTPESAYGYGGKSLQVSWFV